MNLTFHFSETFYSREAILEAVHELRARFPSTVSRADGVFEVLVTGVADPAEEQTVALWLTQLVNDGELRAQIETSLGRARDVVIAAAFSRIIGEPTTDHRDNT